MATPQNVRGHRGGRRFAVHADNENSPFAAHDRGERFGAADSGRPAVARALHDRIIFFNRRRKNHELDVGSILGAMRRMKSQTKPGEPICL